MSEQKKFEPIVTRGYVSERGPFKINENPAINTPIPSSKIKDEHAASGFDYSALAEKFGENETREKVVEMVKAFTDGTSTTMLFAQGGKNGMSLAHAWFGANFPLFRHSHPAYGDCLYYVIAGEITLGKRRLKPGSTFFLPNGMPYKYTAGPAGVELLEFRAGGGVKGAPGISLDELSLDALDKLIEGYNENHDKWQHPANIGDVAYQQRELDFG
jgi:hypothetical protein